MIRNIINGKVYIGKTKGVPAKRWECHQRDARKGRNLMLHQAIRKYGAENFTVETLASDILTVAELNELEKAFITKFRSYPPNLGRGYNMSPGGDGGAEIRLGKKQGPDARRKVAEYRKSHPVVAGSETARKISRALKGRRFTPAWSARKSDAQRGSKNHCFRDLMGQVFGNLKVLEQSKNQPGQCVRWACQCLLCGRIKDVRSTNLRPVGGTRSCGCRHIRRAQ